MFMSAAPPVVADGKGGTRGREESCLLKHFPFQSLRPLIPYLQLILDDIDLHPTIQNLQKQELGKIAFPVAITSAVGMVLAPKYREAEAHHFVVVGLMVSCAVIWNGILFGILFLQLLGITLILCLLCVLVASFLPIGFSWACWLAAALFLLPLVNLLIKPQPAAEGDDA